MATRSNFRLIAYELEPCRLMPQLEYLPYGNLNGSAFAERNALARQIQSVRTQPARMALKAVIGSIAAIGSLPLISKMDSGTAQFAVLLKPEW